MERLGIELALDDNFSKTFSSMSSGVFDVFDKMSSKSGDTVKMWQGVVSSVASSIPIVGSTVSSFIDSMFKAADSKNLKAIETAKNNVLKIVNENALEEAKLKYSANNDEMALSDALHQLRISNIIQEIEARKKAGEDTTKYQISLMEEEARYRDELLKRSFSLVKESMSFEMDQFNFLSKLGANGYTSSSSKLSFLTGEIEKMKELYSVGDVTNISTAEYMKYSNEQKYAVDRIRDMMLEVDRLSKSDIKYGVDLSQNREVKNIETPTINTFNIQVKNDFSNSFITESPREFYSNRFEPLVRETLENEALRYGKK